MAIYLLGIQNVKYSVDDMELTTWMSGQNGRYHMSLKKKSNNLIFTRFGGERPGQL